MRRGSIVATDVWVLLTRSERAVPPPESINNCTDIMLVSPEVYTELVSLMLSGYDIATSRFRAFRLVRSEHYVATAWYF